VNDDQLANELRRRAGASDVPDLLPGVRSAMDARLQPVPATRWAPIAGLAGAVALILLLVVALPRLAPTSMPDGSPVFTGVDSSGSPTSPPVPTFAFVDCGSIGVPVVGVSPVVVSDRTGIVRECRAERWVEEWPDEADDVLVRPLEGDPRSVEVAWLTDACPTERVLIDLAASASGYSAKLIQDQLVPECGYERYARRAILTFAEPITIADVSHQVVAFVPFEIPREGIRFRCAGAGPGPAIIDHTGLVTGCDQANVEKPLTGEIGVSNPLQPDSIHVQWLAEGCDAAVEFDFASGPDGYELIGQRPAEPCEGPSTYPLRISFEIPMPAAFVAAQFAPEPVEIACAETEHFVVDVLGIVESCSGGTPVEGDDVAFSNPDGNEQALNISWTGAVCSYGITLSGRPGDYSMDIFQDSSGCRAAVTRHSVALLLDRPIAVDEISGWSIGGPKPSPPAIEPGSAWWELAPSDRPTPESMSLDVVVHERACANGESPAGRVVGPEIEYGDDAVTITFAVLPNPGDCPSAPGAPVTVQLTEPLGDRQLRDGGSDGAVVLIEASSDLLAVSSERADQYAWARLQAIAGPSECRISRISDGYVPTEAELEEAVDRLGGEDGFIDYGYVSADWLAAARAFGAVEAYEGRQPDGPWWVLLPPQEPDGQDSPFLWSVERTAVSGGRFVWSRGDGLGLDPTCGGHQSAATTACIGATPESGTVSIEDHTGSVVACSVTDGSGATEPSVNTGGSPTSITVEWDTLCHNDLMNTLLRLWHREPRGDASDPSRFQPPYLLMVDRSEAEESWICLEGPTGRSVEIELAEPIRTDEVELFVTQDGRGIDYALPRDGVYQFGLEIGSSGLEYAEGEAIEVSSALVSSVDVTLNCGGPHPRIAMEQLDGPLTFSPGPFLLGCPPPIDLRTDESLMSNFMPAVWAFATPHPLEAYIRDGQLYLPAGTYRFVARSTFGVGERPDDERVELEASVVITVR
jgi:hypothetical protein